MATIQGLTNEQEQEFNRSTKVSKYLHFHQAKVDLFIPLKNRLTKLDDHMTLLGTKAGGKIGVTSGITSTKAARKKEVAVYYETVCGVARSFCIETNRNEVGDNLKYTQPKIINLLDGDVVTVVTEINELITEQLLPVAAFAPYEITAATLTAGLNLATTFANSIGVAGMVDASKSSAGEAVINVLEDIKEDIEVLDLTMRKYITTDPDFYNGFKAANIVDDIGIHHSGIEGEVASNSVAVKGAVIKCVELEKKTTSDIMGHYDIKSMKPGTYEFTCTHPNFEPATKVIKIKKGKTIHVGWELVAL